MEILMLQQTDILVRSVLPASSWFCGDFFLFQHDMAPVSRVRSTQTAGVEEPDWLAQSPDLNAM